jgi:hypothetical protein
MVGKKKSWAAEYEFVKIISMQRDKISSVRGTTWKSDIFTV